METFGPSGTIQIKSYICTLNYNLYIEKIGFISFLFILLGWVIGGYVLLGDNSKKLLLSIKHAIQYYRAGPTVDDDVYDDEDINTGSHAV
jgi:hypothetical protein